MAAAGPAVEPAPDSAREFADFGLDQRLHRAIAKLGWLKPTLIQSRAIPLALAGKDILAGARTGP